MKTATGAQIAAEARSWVDTPYRHQQSLKGRAVDCVGLILGVGRALEILDIPADRWRPYARYSRLPNPSRFMKAMNEFLMPAEFMDEGVIMCIEWRQNMPMHLAIASTHRASDRWMMIHAYEHRQKCVEHGFTEEWEARVTGLWRFPGHTEE